MVSVYLNFNGHFDQLTQQVIQQKNKLNVLIKFRSLEQLGATNDPKPYKINMSWEDEVELNFRDFTKWFVGNFNLSQFILKQGYSHQQKLSILDNINQNICIQDCKLKVDYFGENSNKKNQKKKLMERKHVFKDIALIYEELFKRDHGSRKFERHLQLFCEKHPLGIFLQEAYKSINAWREKEVRNVLRKKKRLIARIQKSKNITQGIDQEVGYGPS